MAREVHPPHEVQSPFFKRLGDELIELTPDHWRDIVLSVSRVTQPATTSRGWHCAIRSAEGFTERVTPSESLLNIVESLAATFAAYSAAFQAAECRVRREADSWRVVIDYRY